MKLIWNEFKTFIQRGSIIELAVAFILGTAFGRIISSLVADIFTPILSLITGRQGFANYKIVIQEADPILGLSENAIYYGMFIKTLLDFLVIALVLFFVIKGVNKMKSQPKEKQIEEAKPSSTDQLLMDIKGLLQKNN